MEHDLSNAENEPGLSPETVIHCENCKENQEFILIGVQKWPSTVAEKLNCNPVVHVWQCSSCHTTLTESHSS